MRCNRQAQANSKITRKSSLVSLLALVTLTARLAGAQDLPSGARQINIVPLNLHAPIQVTAVFDKSQNELVPRGPHQTVTIYDASPKWLTDISFVVENHSQKDITAIEVEVFLPQWEVDVIHPRNIIKFHEGKLPEHALQDRDGRAIEEESSLTFDIKPNTSGVVPLSQAFSKLRYREHPEQVSLGRAEAATIQIERIVFSDGTMWAHNAYLRPDVTSPGAYVQDTQSATTR